MEVFKDCSCQRLHQGTADSLELLLPGLNFVNRMTNAKAVYALWKRLILNFRVFKHCEASRT